MADDKCIVCGAPYENEEGCEFCPPDRALPVKVEPFHLTRPSALAQPETDPRRRRPSDLAA